MLVKYIKEYLIIAKQIGFIPDFIIKLLAFLYKLK